VGALRLSQNFKKTLDKRLKVCYNNYSEREEYIMINIRTLRKLTNNDGLTLKNGKAITYKTGYQVATEGIETKSQEEAMKAIRAYKGDCGIWFAEGVYYIDKSHRVATKREALAVGRACNQISVLNWRTMGLVYC
jgi:hypothetical protein